MSSLEWGPYRKASCTDESRLCECRLRVVSRHPLLVRKRTSKPHSRSNLPLRQCEPEVPLDRMTDHIRREQVPFE